MKLSVCVPIYNMAPYVEKCARSLFKQTYGDLEFVFVDDCSSDGSAEVVERVAQGFPDRLERVKILRHGQNRGAAAARWTAVGAATGSLIVFCDADDWVDSDLYERMVEQLERANADAVMCPTRFETPSGSVLRGRTDVFRARGADVLRNMDEYLGFSSLVLRVVRRELLSRDDYEIPKGLHSAEDLCLSAQLLARCGILTNIAGGAVYHYRQHAASLSHTVDAARIVSDHRRVFEVLERKIPAEIGIAICRHLARTVLYWGTTHGILSRDEYLRWREAYVSRGGTFAFDNCSPWGRRLMQLADWNFALARCLSPCVRRRICDGL